MNAEYPSIVIEGLAYAYMAKVATLCMYMCVCAVVQLENCVRQLVRRSWEEMAEHRYNLSSVFLTLQASIQPLAQSA